MRPFLTLTYNAEPSIYFDNMVLIKYSGNGEFSRQKRKLIQTILIHQFICFKTNPKASTVIQNKRLVQFLNFNFTVYSKHYIIIESIIANIIDWPTGM